VKLSNLLRHVVAFNGLLKSLRFTVPVLRRRLLMLLLDFWERRRRINKNICGGRGLDAANLNKLSVLGL
jgi:hypothetical protein